MMTDRNASVQAGLVIMVGVCMVVTAVSYYTQNANRLQALRGASMRTEEEAIPPFSELIDTSTQTVNEGADLQFLVDFGIVGHAKTGTSTMMRWLKRHDDVIMPSHEVHGLTFGKIAEFSGDMYAQYEGQRHKHGFKAPNDISSPFPRELIRQHFPSTKLIIGLRHPVRFFESYYNFNQRAGRRTIPPPETLVGDRMPAQVLYHAHLAGMGKTNLSDPVEAELVRPYLSLSSTQIFLLGLAGRFSVSDPQIKELQDPHYQPKLMNNPVFLYDVSQPFDTDRQRNKLFREDLSKFVGLSSPLDELVPRKSSKNHHYQIDICEGKYDYLRKELLEIGRAASTWLIDYFIVLPEVTTSSPEHLKDILLSWRFDPCLTT